ncbi:MAG TPA: hypothetical protein VK151_07715 [Fluviicola sp.]|nr:hypothetical protein [Fluviicola sp.]
MKQSLIILGLAALSTVSAWGQSTGFYGKKAFVEFSGLGSMPLLINMFSNYDYYVKRGSGLTTGKDRFNGGFTGGVGIQINPEAAISFNFGLSYLNTVGPEALYFPTGDNFYSVYVNHENLTIRSMTLMPVLHFASNKSTIMPAGFSHEIGFGFVRTKVLERDYVFTGSDDYGNEFYYNGDYHNINEFMDSVVSVNGDYIDYGQTYKGFTIMYGIKMRTPVSKQLMINYGIRYTYNIASNNFQYNVTPNSYEKALNNEIENSIRATRLRSFISLQLGLTCLF